MGLLVANGLHYGEDCVASLALTDNPEAYDTVSLASATVNALGVVVWTHHTGVVREAYPVPTPPTAHTWHYINECPYA